MTLSTAYYRIGRKRALLLLTILVSVLYGLLSTHASADVVPPGLLQAAAQVDPQTRVTQISHISRMTDACQFLSFCRWQSVTNVPSEGLSLTNGTAVLQTMISSIASLLFAATAFVLFLLGMVLVFITSLSFLTKIWYVADYAFANFGKNALLQDSPGGAGVHTILGTGSLFMLVVLISALVIVVRGIVASKGKFSGGGARLATHDIKKNAVSSLVLIVLFVVMTQAAGQNHNGHSSRIASASAGGGTTMQQADRVSSIAGDSASWATFSPGWFLAKTSTLTNSVGSLVNGVMTAGVQSITGTFNGAVGSSECSRYTNSLNKVFESTQAARNPLSNSQMLEAYSNLYTGTYMKLYTTGIFGSSDSANRVWCRSAESQSTQSTVDQVVVSRDAGLYSLALGSQQLGKSSGIAGTDVTATGAWSSTKGLTSSSNGLLSATQYIGPTYVSGGGSSTYYFAGCEFDSASDPGHLAPDWAGVTRADTGAPLSDSDCVDGDYVINEKLGLGHALIKSSHSGSAWDYFEKNQSLGNAVATHVPILGGLVDSNAHSNFSNFSGGLSGANSPSDFYALTQGFSSAKVLLLALLTIGVAGFLIKVVLPLAVGTFFVQFLAAAVLLLVPLVMLACIAPFEGPRELARRILSTIILSTLATTLLTVAFNIIFVLCNLFVELTSTIDQTDSSGMINALLVAVGYVMALTVSQLIFKQMGLGGLLSPKAGLRAPFQFAAKGMRGEASLNPTDSTFWGVPRNRKAEDEEESRNKKRISTAKGWIKDRASQGGGGPESAADRPLSTDSRSINGGPDLKKVGSGDQTPAIGTTNRPVGGSAPTDNRPKESPMVFTRNPEVLKNLGNLKRQAEQAAAGAAAGGAAGGGGDGALGGATSLNKSVSGAVGSGKLGTGTAPGTASSSQSSTSNVFVRKLDANGVPVKDKDGFEVYEEVPVNSPEARMAGLVTEMSPAGTKSEDVLTKRVSEQRTKQIGGNKGTVIDPDGDTRILGAGEVAAMASTPGKEVALRSGVARQSAVASVVPDPKALLLPNGMLLRSQQSTEEWQRTAVPLTPEQVGQAAREGKTPREIGEMMLPGLSQMIAVGVAAGMAPVPGAVATGSAVGSVVGTAVGAEAGVRAAASSIGTVTGKGTDGERVLASVPGAQGDASVGAAVPGLPGMPGLPGTVASPGTPGVQPLGTVPAPGSPAAASSQLGTASTDSIARAVARGLSGVEGQVARGMESGTRSVGERVGRGVRSGVADGVSTGMADSVGMFSGGVYEAVRSATIDGAVDGDVPNFEIPEDIFETAASAFNLQDIVEGQHSAMERMLDALREQTEAITSGNDDIVSTITRQGEHLRVLSEQQIRHLDEISDDLRRNHPADFAAGRWPREVEASISHLADEITNNSEALRRNRRSNDEVVDMLHRFIRSR